MRSTKRADLDTVAARFAGWRFRRTTREIPKELWAAAAGLVERYGVSAVCARLRLNATRFNEMRAALGTTTAGAVVPAFASFRAEASSESAAGGRGAFLELPALRMASVGRDAAERDGDCTLVLDGASGARLTIVLRQPNPELVDAVCQLVLASAATRGGEQAQR